MKWEEVYKETISEDSMVGTEVTEKMTIPEGTLYRSVICIGVRSLSVKLVSNQFMVFVPKNEKG
jgi:hypothetical protein